MKVSGTIMLFAPLVSSSLFDEQARLCMYSAKLRRRRKKQKGVFLVDESERRQHGGRQLDLFGVLFVLFVLPVLVGGDGAGGGGAARLGRGGGGRGAARPEHVGKDFLG